ncbi:biotin--[acetyl-CoA-carboxylase] ligase [Aquirufa sp.]|uniref:biotin--[acetyl-CoA-carboxylase] ligase n=1 Tax=Aquirufa sp. TaxID=2676249 RepID=UPI0037C0D7DB
MNNYQAPTRFVGKFTKFIKSCESTNTLAFEESINLDLPEGFAWIAGHQTAGKGQRGNHWTAEANKNLLVSYALKPPHELVTNQFYLSKCIALGVILGIQNWAQNYIGHHLRATIKWPNDIYLDEYKLGGILIENNFQSGKWSFAIIGIGINVNQSLFDGLRATSLRQFTPTQNVINISNVFDFISMGIEYYYDQFTKREFQLIDENYHKNLFRNQEWHTFRDAAGIFKGKILEVDAKGQIQIEVEGQTKGYDIKELNFIFSE